MPNNDTGKPKNGNKVEPEKFENRDWERKNWGWGLGCGIVMFLYGLIASIAGYVTAEAGESYAIYWGLMVVGILSIVGALMMRGRKR